MGWFGRLKKPILAAAVIFLLVAGFFFGRSRIFSWVIREGSQVVTPADDSLPFKKEILSALDSVEYSALPIFLDPAVTLKVDFARKFWVLKNFREYDGKGAFLLKNSRYGLCAELSVHIFDRIKPLMGERYSLQFMRVVEPDFFDSSESNHIALFLHDMSSGNDFLIDPSFHRYGRFEDFPRYKILESRKDSLGAFEKRDPDLAFSVDSTIPLVIREDSLVAFSVESVEGVFDRNNVILAITARRSESRTGSYLFVFRKKSGKVTMLQKDWDKTSLLTSEERAQLGEKLSLWMRGL